MSNIIYPIAIFFLSLIVCIFPRILTSVSHIKKYYTYLIAVSAGFMLGVLLLEFIPHILEEHDMCKEQSEDEHCSLHNTKKSKCMDKHSEDKHTHEDGNEDKHTHEDKHTDEEDGHIKDAHSEHSHSKHNEHTHDHHTHNGHSHENHTHTHKFNIGLFVAGVCFIFLIAVDTLILHHSHCDSKDLQDHTKHDHDSFGTCNTAALKYTTSITQAIILVTALSIHSFFEGLIFGQEGSKSIEYSIIFHKLLESFALGVTIASSQFNFATCIFLFVFYSSLTPLGMIVGNQSKHFGKSVRDIFGGLALGSTMFIVCIEMIPPLFHDNSSKNENVWKVVFLGGGFLLTSAVFGIMSNSHVH